MKKKIRSTVPESGVRTVRRGGVFNYQVIALGSLYRMKRGVRENYERLV